MARQRQVQKQVQRKRYAPPSVPDQDPDIIDESALTAGVDKTLEAIDEVLSE